MHTVRSVVASCIIGMLVTATASSQTISGVITDSAGHPLPGAEARLASMDLQTVAAGKASVRGTFSVTVPRASHGPRRYWAELCAPGFAPQVQAVPMADGDTLVVRGALTKARTRIVPMGPGACAWDAGAAIPIVGGRGFGVVAGRTAEMVDSIRNALPHDSAGSAAALRTVESTWLHKLHAAGNAAARERAAWVLLQLAVISDEKPDSMTFARLRRALPATSAWWQAGNGGVPLLPLEAVQTLFGVEARNASAATLAARRSARDYVARIAAAKYDPDVDAQRRHELALFALGMRDTAEANAQARTLIMEYPGYTASKLAMFRMPWLSPLRAGNRMPEFDFAALRSTPRTSVTNRDLRAPYTLLVFWGTWCEQCLKEIPQIDSLQREYHERGLDIVSVAADDSPEVVSAFVASHHMTWRQVYAGTTQDPQLLRLGVLGYPTTLVIDSTGAIRASRFGLTDLRTTLAPFVGGQ